MKEKMIFFLVFEPGFNIAQREMQGTTYLKSMTYHSARQSVLLPWAFHHKHDA